MKKQLEYYGHVSIEGRLHIHNRHRFVSDIAALFTDSEIDIKITARKKKRSLRLNSYYWAVVVALVKERFQDLGHEITLEMTHDYLKARFNFKEVVIEATAEVIQVPLSTTTLTSVEFMEYMEKVKKWAAETLEVVIPEPGEQVELSFE